MMVINHFLTWRDRCVIVIAEEKSIGIRFFGDTDEDFIEGNGFYCGLCNKPLTGKQSRFCSLRCKGISMRHGIKRAEWHKIGLLK